MDDKSILITVKQFLEDNKVYEDKKSHICVLFADLVGSTEFKKYHFPREGLAKTVKHNDVASRVINEHGGKIVKYIGDAVMAIFCDDNCGQNAVRAGLDIICKMGEANNEQGWRGDYEMCTKIGVNEGDAWYFKYDTSDFDPQGTTVDVAARFASLSGPNQLVCTKELHEKVKSDENIPSVCPSCKRYVKGLKEPLELVALAPEGFHSDINTLEGQPFPKSDVLKHAEDLKNQKRYNDAITEFKRILENDPGNFHANMYLSELIISQTQGKTNEMACNILAEASKCIERAKWSRPKSCKVWLLEAWVNFKYFEIKKDVNFLDDAIQSVRKSFDRAADSHNFGSMISAKVRLAMFLAYKAKNDEALQESLREAIQIFEEYADRVANLMHQCRSDFWAMYAFARILSGETDDIKISTMLDKAREFNPHNHRIHLAEKELALKCHGDGGPMGLGSDFL